MTLEIILTEEQADCLNDVATEQGVTQEAFCVELVMATVRNITKNAYEGSLARLGAAAMVLPYSDRKDITEQTAAQIAAKLNHPDDYTPPVAYTAHEDGTITLD